MLTGTCNACNAEAEFPTCLAGLNVRCKACGNGWIAVPPRNPEAAPGGPRPVSPLTEERPYPATPGAAGITAPSGFTVAAPTSVHESPPAARHDPAPTPFTTTDRPPVDEGSMSAQRRWGGVLVLFGLGSILLPSVGLQFRWMRVFESGQPAFGLALAAVGGIMIAMSLRSGQ